MLHDKIGNMARKAQAQVAQAAPRVLYLNDVDDTLSFTAPYPVTIEHEDGEHVARLVDLNLYGNGDTEYEAVAMLKREIVSLYHDLAKTPPKKLGKHPREWMRFLLHHLSCAR